MDVTVEETNMYSDVLLLTHETVVLFLSADSEFPNWSVKQSNGVEHISLKNTQLNSVKV